MFPDPWCKWRIQCQWVSGCSQATSWYCDHSLFQTISMAQYRSENTQSLVNLIITGFQMHIVDINYCLQGKMFTVDFGCRVGIDTSSFWATCATGWLDRTWPCHLRGSWQIWSSHRSGWELPEYRWCGSNYQGRTGGCCQHKAEQDWSFSFARGRAHWKHYKLINLCWSLWIWWQLLVIEGAQEFPSRPLSFK